MALPSSLTSPSAAYALPPPDLAGARGSRDPAVRAVEPARALGDALQRPNTGQDGARGFVLGAEPEAQRGPRTRTRDPGPPGPLAPAGPEAPVFASGGSVPFLVQLLGQEPGGRELGGRELGGRELGGRELGDEEWARPQIFVAEHRKAAELGSDAYRRIGATPPLYTEQATLFSFAI